MKRARSILVLGATSAMAQDAIGRLAARGAALFLVGRDAAKLAAVADDARARGARTVHTRAQDLDETPALTALVADADATLGGLDAALVAHGVLGDNDKSARDAELAERILHTNLISAGAAVVALAALMEQRRAGALVVITSVAGDRGRGSNAVYGASKAGLQALLSGLRNQLFRAGVRVVDVRPGMVDSPMTAGLSMPRVLVATPAQIGGVLVDALDGRTGDIVYAPAWWRLVMLGIRAVPEPLFKRLKL
ncbi:MAG: short-chain dehydrogenase [Deltaproteobacteria bacterium RBG_16_71_12]|nr:MAG: short-chain dehydrogenase [Deltaproteobacteria bacterium RBG_16_71_12]